MPQSKAKIALFWFRRDLRLQDNHGLQKALDGPFPVLPIFIFDTEITHSLAPDDARLAFIHEKLQDISAALSVAYASSIYCLHAAPLQAWATILNQFNVKAVYANEDYEPYAIDRDETIGKLLSQKGIPFHLCKDQVVFAKNDILKSDQTPYTVFTPYKNKWLSQFTEESIIGYSPQKQANYAKLHFPFPSIADLGFVKSPIKVKDYSLENLGHYEKTRDFPSLGQTSHLSPHLRFGTISIRAIVQQMADNPTFLSELIWREFFMQISFPFSAGGAS